MDQIQEVRAGRGKKQNQYFISHNNDEIIDRHSNIKENWTFVNIPIRSKLNEMEDFNAECVQCKQVHFLISHLSLVTCWQLLDVGDRFVTLKTSPMVALNFSFEDLPTSLLEKTD